MRRRALLATAGTALVAGCRSRLGGGSDCSVDADRNPGEPDWVTSTGDLRNTRSVPRGAAPEPPLSVEWTMRVGGHVGIPSPTVIDGTAYTTDMDTSLYAVDAATGETTWTAGTKPAGVPVVTGGAVAVAGDDDTLAAFERGDATRRWLTEVGASVGGLVLRPTVAAGVALVPTSRGLWAFDLSTGDRRWHYETGLSVGPHPAVVDDTVYAAGEDAYVHGLDVETGERTWWAKTPASVETPPAVVDGTVYAAADDGSVLAVDTATGERIWTASVDDRPERLGVDGGRVYVASDGTLYALCADDGERCFQFDRMSSSYAGGMAASPDRLYVTSGDGSVTGDSTLAALDPVDGSVEWRHDAADYRFTSGPAVVDGAVYVGGAVTGGNHDSGLSLFKLT